MSQADYRGARGANAGDDFHELWALRQALTLLDQDTGLTAVTVEGLRAEDEAGSPLDTWDGVDCTFYFGGDQAASAERIIVDQLKYSAADPDQPWTIARITRSSNKKRDNSLIGRLAKAFVGLRDRRPDLVANGKVLLRLVSNQPVDTSVLNAFSIPMAQDQNSDSVSGIYSTHETILAASGLLADDFDAFARSLDFSECGRGSRFALEERILTTISEWTDADARATVNDLMRFVRRTMMPESKGDLIIQQSILSQLGFSDSRALFPCPPKIAKIERLIRRQVSRTVTERMLSGASRICLHGEGGCGKTTVLQEIEVLLPADSVIVIFDCYGGGRYLDSDSFRHRPRDAFLQLSNDLARQLRIPLLLSGSASLDFPRVFKKRLDRAAEVMEAKNHNALLVVVVDAADNSVTAASKQSESSFIHDFVALGDLPKNVRLLVTARTGRLSSLKLPREFFQIEICGFSPGETAAHVQSMWDPAHQAWVDDFHHLSRGNPRVQRYALDYAGANPEHALDYLRPNGKGLNQVFQEQFDFARHKVGHDEDILSFCSGLIALPRPVPIADLAAVTGLSETHLWDLATDLAPGLRLLNKQLSFADEDFEHFVRSEAEAHLGPVQARVADHFAHCYRYDAYAAANVAPALFAAGRRREIIDLIDVESEPTPISDPVLRREIQLQRLRIAMKVCRETGNNVDALLTLLIGAEALKTNTAIRRALVENPDLTAAFAPHASAAAILRDSNEIEHHGPLLFHIMATDAHEGDAIAVREGHRHVQAWMQRRTQSFDDQRRQHPNIQPQGWNISYSDIAAETEALLRIAGPRRAVGALLQWHPRSIALQVARTLSTKLITSGDAALVEQCIMTDVITSPWDIFVLTPLALAGKKVDLARLETSLSTLLRRRLIRLDRQRYPGSDDNPVAENLELILTACEVIVARGSDHTCLVPVLQQLAGPELRRRDRLSTSDISRIDLILRAHTLLERLAGNTTTLESFLVDPPKPVEELAPERLRQHKRWDDERNEALQALIGPIVDVYNVRAAALTGLIPEEEVELHLQKAVTRISNHDYRFNSSPYAQAMRTRVALSVARLLAVPSLDRRVLWEYTHQVLDSSSGSLGATEAEVFSCLALDHSLHQRILSTISNRARATRHLKIAAEDKISGLIRLARVLLPISGADAEIVFNDAIEVASEVNAEAIHEIALFSPLATRAVDTMDIDTRRTVARDLAVVVGDAGVRLEGQEFPWSQVAEAISTLDTCLALAAVARWEDSGLIGRETLLPPILETAVVRRELSPVQVLALSSLLDTFSTELVARIVEEANEQRSLLDVQALQEDLAKEELLRFGHGSRQVVSDALRSIPTNSDTSFWFNQLMKASAFHRVERPRPPSSTRADQPWQHIDEVQEVGPDPLESIDWTSHRFVSVEDISYVINQVFEAADAAKTYISSTTILDQIADSVALADRYAHLEALSRGDFHHVDDYDLANALTKRIDAWQESPSVIRWCRDRLIHVVVDKLPSLSRWIMYGQSPLPSLLKRSGVSQQQIVAALLDGVERHADSLNAATAFALVGLVGQHCTPEDAAQVIERYARRLVQRIPDNDQDRWDITDIPTEAAGSLARFLYAMMGDVDVRTRWRAAHVLRRLTRLGDTKSLDKVLELYNRTSESSYRIPGIPFYWLAARLWLVIALDRIASEKPSAVRHHRIWLLGIAIDEGFPHILLRSFAKSAVCKLVENGHLTLDIAQQDLLKLVNTSRLRPKKVRQRHSVGFDRYHYHQREDRRFDFDSMDTLPYWYTPALRAFADVSQEEFLDAAESWIVDRWHVQNNPRQWADEPRKHRDDRQSRMSLDHRHGSLPILERFHTYLEWHAMWCATGELLQTRALAKAGEDGYDSFEDWLSGSSLTTPPLWLADLHGMKPLEDRLWFAPPTDINGWVDDISDDDFLAELGYANTGPMIVVGSYYDTRGSDLRLSARVETGLVSPDTASSLARAIQTVSDPWDYRIPPAGNELEIDVPPYKLVGWLIDVHHDLRIDEHDPLRYEARAIERVPSEKTARTLNLAILHEDPVRWVNEENHQTVFAYEAWGDNRGDESEERLRYNERIRSRGWRLQINRESLRAFLNEVGLDLIVEVEITRRNRGYEDSRYSQEKAEEARYDRVLILRRDGTIETAEGRLGTWTSSGA